MKNFPREFINIKLGRTIEACLKSHAGVFQYVIIYFVIGLTSLQATTYAQQVDTTTNSGNRPPRREVKWINSDIKEMPGLTHHVLKSNALNTDVGYVVWLPKEYSEKKKKQFPVIYFLHGAGGTEASDGVGFSEKVAEAIFGKLASPVICVFPNGGMSGYRGEVEKMIVEELIPTIDKEYRTLAKSESRAIAGFSMGGSGSVYLAIMHPELFSAAGSMGGGIGARRGSDEDALQLETSIDKVLPVWKKSDFGFFMVNGDSDNPDAFKPFAEKLERNDIDYERIIQPDTKHNLGLYYEGSALNLIAFLNKHLKK